MELRLVGLSSYRIFPVLDRELAHLHVSPTNPFWIVLVDFDTRELVNDWRAKQKLPVLVAEAPQSGSSEREPAGPTWNSVREHCDTVIALLKESFPSVDVGWTIKAQAKARARETFKIEFGFSGHNGTIPNELLLMSVGGTFDGAQEPVVGEDATYLSRILQVADEAAIVRHAVPAGKISGSIPLLPTVILASPGMYRHASKARPKKGQGHSPFFRTLRKLQQQRTYGLHFDNEAEAKEIMNDPKSQQLLHMRTLEQIAFTNALAIRSASYLCPVLRLSPAVNHTRSALVRLSDCMRSRNPSPRKVSRLTTELGQALHEAVPPEFVDRIDMPHVGVKLVSDAPLEFLPIRDLPLFLRHITSRIPVTPGNQAFLELLPHEQVQISTEKFSETLVIRSFRDDDPLRTDFETAVKSYPRSDGSALPVRFVDVRTKRELEQAFNAFDGALVVFDGHGHHKRHQDVGELQLVDESVNVWNLRAKVRVPPIVFLCACDTHAFDRSHVTPGAGLLACGCRTVISTVLPVESNIAAMLGARLLFRIYEYLPRVTNELRQSVRWDNVFAMMQRMMYVTELVMSMPTRAGRDEGWRQAVLARATLTIHTKYDWYEIVRDDISQSSGLSTDEIETRRKDKLSFPESLKYVQLGNPESIIILPVGWQTDEYLAVRTPASGTD
jgi:hypothetical protein